MVWIFLILEYLEFGFSAALPRAADGTVFAFPVYQQCTAANVRWNEMFVGAAHPSPTITVFKNSTLLKSYQVYGVSSSESSTGRSLFLGATLAGIYTLF